MSQAEYDSQMSALKVYAQAKELNMTHTFRGAGGFSNGTISKPRFKTALGILFHHFPLTEEFIAAIALKYGCGQPDFHGGGYTEVLWRTFAVDLSKVPDPATPPPPDPFDPSIFSTMQQLRQMADDKSLAMVHAFQGAGGISTGVIQKPKFVMTLTTLLFPQLNLTQAQLDDICLVYANKNGPPDLRLGGYTEVLWRNFCSDVRKTPLPEVEKLIQKRVPDATTAEDAPFAQHGDI